MGTEKSLMQRLLDAGYPKDQIFHHESDLYVFVTPMTTEVLDKWLEDNGWRNLRNDPLFVGKFKDQITGRQMYDVAFQFYEEAK